MKLPIYKLLLEYTTIDKNFIQKIKINNELNFNIEDIKIFNHI